MTAVEDKIPDVSGFFKKTDYSTKIIEIERKVSDHNHDKYITTPEFNEFTAKIFAAKLAQGNLVTKTDFDTKLINFSKKINSKKAKHLLLKMNWRSYTDLIQAILEAKIILKMMAHKIT